MDGGSQGQGLSRLVAGPRRRVHPFFDCDQIVESARRHRSHQPGLVLVAVDPTLLGSRLHWEPSRGGDLFPHLYGALSLNAVLWVVPLPLGPAGRHVFPELDP